MESVLLIIGPLGQTTCPLTMAILSCAMLPTLDLMEQEHTVSPNCEVSGLLGSERETVEVRDEGSRQVRKVCDGETGHRFRSLGLAFQVEGGAQAQSA